MARGLMVFAVVCLMMVSVYGCGIKARTYVAERERVDQVNTGNAGYVKGEGSSMAGRPTRKVYVFELEREKKNAVKKAAKAKEKKATVADNQAQANQAANATSSNDDASTVTVPVVEDSAVTVSSGEQKFTEYTVEKDDTLQKISKKFYGAFNKWTKIYDANKDKIKNPNFVKPGTVILIPQE